MDVLDNPQVDKFRIHGYLEAVTGMQISDKVMVDMLLDPSGDKITILGRPQVEGSARSQMRHVTPYAIMEFFIKSKFSSKRPHAELITQLSEPIKTFVLYQPGICVNQTEYSKLKGDLGLTEDFYHIKINSTGGGPYRYLINDMNIINSLDDEYFNNHTQNYVSNMFDFLDHSMDSLKKAIKDKNTVGIACEAIGRLILTMFNQRPHAVFPKEGNTLNYEIRLYKTIKDAKDASSTNFEVITHDEAAELATTSHKLKVKTGAKVRIAHNEGNIVKKAIDCLKRIEKIIFLVNDKDDEEAKLEIEDYNTRDSQIKVRTSKEMLDRCNTEINFDDIYNYKNTVGESDESTEEPDEEFDDNMEVQQDVIESDESTEEPGEESDDNMEVQQNVVIDYIKYHIAKHLYTIFDFKPLEKKVLVAIGNREVPEQDIIKVYPSAGADWQAKYQIQDGADYRKNAINSATGYNKKSVFREEETDLQLLASKVVDHVYLSLLPFRLFQLGFKNNGNYVDDNYALKVLEIFSAMVVSDYEVDETLKETFENHISTEKEVIKMFRSNDDSMLFDNPELLQLVYNIELSGNNEF